MKKLKISKDNIISIDGLIICLLSLIIIFSGKSAFSFLSVGILGAFGFIGFWILVPLLFLLGIYMIFRKKLIKYRVDISLWGIFIIFLALLVLSSGFGADGQIVTNNILSSNGEETKVVLSMFNQGTVVVSGQELSYEYLRFNTCVDYFNEIAINYAKANGLGEAISDGLYIGNNHLGGGYIGYVFCGLLNNGITPIGTTILSWLLIVIGLALIFNRYIKKGFLYLKSSRQRKAAHEDVYSSSEESEFQIGEPDKTDEDISGEYLAPNDEEKVSPEEYNELAAQSFNITHGLEAPKFSLEENSSNESPFIQDQLYQNNPYSEVNINQSELNEEPIVNENIESPVNDISVDETFEPYVEHPTNVESSFTEPTIENKPVEVETPIEQRKIIETITDPTHRSQPKATIKPHYTLPPLDLLDLHERAEDLTKNEEYCQKRVEDINRIFSNLNTGAECVGYKTGPSVTRYNIITKSNVSVSNIKRIVEDISIRLGGVPVRFEPIVLGESTSGLEIQNEIRINVGLRESLTQLPEGEKYIYNIPFGKDISGHLLHASITSFPHMLVGGTTGSGKSIYMHSMILSLLMRTTPYELKLLLIDPKKVEMPCYKDIPHLLCPIISEPRKALVALRKLVDEMQRRYNVFEENHVREIKEFNKFAKENNIEPLPVIAVFIDEYADLNDDCKEIREPVVRIAQKARAAGIHMIIATQRPSVNVIDGVIKANLTTHVALMVANSIDSSTILGEGGAEKLLGNGDMIVDCPAITHGCKPRVQGCFVETSEINRVVDYLRKQSAPMYDPEFLDLTDHSQDNLMSGDGIPAPDLASLKEASEEQLYERIKTDLLSKEYCSISFIQRTYGVGFPKAGRLFAKLQKEGIVALQGDARGSKVLVHEAQSESPTSIDESTLYANDEIEEDDN